MANKYTKWCVSPSAVREMQRSHSKIFVNTCQNDFNENKTGTTPKFWPECGETVYTLLVELRNGLPNSLK
jgi:hypothetical protein